MKKLESIVSDKVAGLLILGMVLPCCSPGKKNQAEERLNPFGDGISVSDIPNQVIEDEDELDQHIQIEATQNPKDGLDLREDRMEAEMDDLALLDDEEE